MDGWMFLTSLRLSLVDWTKETHDFTDFPQVSASCQPLIFKRASLCRIKSSGWNAGHSSCWLRFDGSFRGESLNSLPFVWETWSFSTAGNHAGMKGIWEASSPLPGIILLHTFIVAFPGVAAAIESTFQTGCDYREIHSLPSGWYSGRHKSKVNFRRLSNIHYYTWWNRNILVTHIWYFLVTA